MAQITLSPFLHSRQAPADMENEDKKITSLQCVLTNYKHLGVGSVHMLFYLALDTALGYENKDYIALAPRI